MDGIDEALDPRIQIELENLNDATDDINKLETELDEAHNAFRQLLSETTKRLKEILNKVGNSCVEKARCYYEALEVARQAQIKCQQQAQLFQRASEIHAAAKETVALAESRFMLHQHEWNFDQAWQDMLNHATFKVMDAENQKTECGREHYRRAVLFHNAEKRLLQLEEKHHRAIIKARPYFEVKAQCDQMLATQKERVECLQKAIQDAKTNYASSLRKLEDISNQIHQQRRDYDFIANGPREPGVGAELVSPRKISDYNMEHNHPNGNKVKDITSNQLEKYNIIDKYDNICQLEDDSQQEHLGKRSVDGSEARSLQWELELEATMENLNNLTHESSLIQHDGKIGNVSDLHFSNEKNTIPNHFLRELGHTSLKNKDYSMQNLNQFKKLSTNWHILKNSIINMSGVTHFEESNVLHHDISDPVISNKHKINLKNTSKSLSNSPLKTNVFSLGSKITQKEIRQTIAKYVSNNVFNFGFNNTKSRSCDDINTSLDVNTCSIEKYQSLDGTIGNKTDNFEFNNQATKLENNTRLCIMKDTYDKRLNMYCAQLSDISRTNVKSVAEIMPEKKWFRSNSEQFLPSGDRISSIKVIQTSSSQISLNRKLISNSSQGFAVKKLTEQTLISNELPLLSLFKQSNLLSTTNAKSLSMVNLSVKWNFLSLDDVYPNSIKASSTGRLVNIKDNSFFRSGE